MSENLTTREFCQRCQRLSPVGFFSPKPMWKAVAGQWEHSILCIVCFGALGDEKYLPWEQGLEFYPVSFVMHRNLSATGTETTDG